MAEEGTRSSLPLSPSLTRLCKPTAPHQPGATSPGHPAVLMLPEAGGDPQFTRLVPRR